VKVTLNVSERFRGEAGDSLVVGTEISSEACGYPFEVGQDYLIFAYRTAGNWSVSICSATQPARVAIARILQLRALRDGDTAANIFGFAGTHRLSRGDSSWEEVQPVPGLTVTAERNGREYQIQTAADGSFAFRGMPPGYYHLNVTPPPGRVVLPEKTGREAGQEVCPVRFEIFYDGRISGTVVNPDGKPLPGFVSAQFTRLDRVNAIAESSVIQADGSFQIPRLGPGLYRLVYSPPLGAGPTPSSYYPGTSAISQAGLIEIDDGTHIEALKFRIP
jgi:hypothetical protein